MAELKLLAGEQFDGESPRAIHACNDYLRMGPGRSLEKLHRTYTADAPQKPPTRHLRTLKEWSTNYSWVARASIYAAEQDAAKTSEQQRLLSEGLAADFERIRELTTIYDALKNVFDDGNGLWYKDIKLSAKGDTVEVDVFNSALLSQMRGVLDDVAKEVGGRKQAVNHSGQIELDVNDPRDELLSRIGRLATRSGAQPGDSGDDAG